jgi:hypothetical protein
MYAKTWSILVVLMLAAGQPGMTQEQDKEQGKYSTLDVLINPQPQEQTPEAAENIPNTQPVKAVPVQAAQETQAIGALSYIDDIFQSVRNRWGFSLSTYESYTSALYETNNPGQSSGITSFTSRAFLNFGTQKSSFHFDLGTGYRKYNRSEGSNSWDYSASVSVSKQFSKRVSFGLANQFRSSYNDAWSFFSPYSQINYYPDFSGEVFLDRQRISQNSLSANLNFRLARKMQFGVFGNYHYYNYAKNTFGNENSSQAGVSLGYQVKEWLSLGSNYSFYVNRGNDNSGNANTANFEPAALQFHLPHSWRAWAGGGAQVAYYTGPRVSGYRGKAHFTESINAGIQHASGDATFSLTYHRGFASAIGISELLAMDRVIALFSYRITSWMIGSLQSRYYRSNELGSNGLLRTFSSGGGLQFALWQNISAVVNAFYQNQNIRDFSIQGLGINRITGYVGLQYFWPSRQTGL